MREQERRDFSGKFQIERRDGGKTVLRGHAAVFNSPTDIGGFIEEIRPGFFRNAIKTSDVRALFNHDSNYVLGRNTAGTLELEEDSVGLAVVIRPPDSQTVKDLVLTPMERGDISAMSFSFIVKAGGDRWEKLPGGGQKRILIEAEELFDVSIVTYPAYAAADDIAIAQRMRMMRGAVGITISADHDAQAEGEARARAFQLGSSDYRLNPESSARKWTGDSQGEGEARARMFQFAGVRDSQESSGHAGLPSFVRYSDELARQAQAAGAARARSLGLTR